jgi:hypothetical protein
MESRFAESSAMVMRDNQMFSVPTLLLPVLIAIPISRLTTNTVLKMF